MPNDIVYGSDAEVRIGVMADIDTDPTNWHYLAFESLSATKTRERNRRNNLGRARNNRLDATKPRPGFEKFALEMVVDGDTRMIPRVLRCLMGAPTTTGPTGSIYNHVWQSGAVDPVLCAIQIEPADGTKIHVYRGVVLGAISHQMTGETTQNFDFGFSLRALRLERVADWIGDAPVALADEAPVYREEFRVDGVVATNILSGQWGFDRQLKEDAFLSATAELSGIRPGGGVHSGQVTARALGEVFDDIEEEDTEFAARFDLLGTVADTKIQLEHAHAQLTPATLPITSEAELERTWAWTAHQTASEAAAKITVKNTVTSYASA